MILIPRYPRGCEMLKKLEKLNSVEGKIRKLIFTLPMTLNFGFSCIKNIFSANMHDEYSKWPQIMLNSHKRGQGYISLQGYFWLFGYFWLILRGMVGMVGYKISKIQPKILSWLPKSSISVQKSSWYLKGRQRTVKNNPGGKYIPVLF